MGAATVLIHFNNINNNQVNKYSTVLKRLICCRFDSTNEEIKPRSRPRGTSKQIIENFGLIGPPELQPLTSREHSAVLKEYSTMSREHPVAARERPVVTQGHPVAAAQGHPLVAPEHSTPLAEGKNSANSLAFHQNERPRSSEDSRSQLVASLKSSSLVCYLEFSHVSFPAVSF